MFQAIRLRFPVPSGAVIKEKIRENGFIPLLGNSAFAIGQAFVLYSAFHHGHGHFNMSWNRTIGSVIGLTNIGFSIFNRTNPGRLAVLYALSIPSMTLTNLEGVLHHGYTTVPGLIGYSLRCGFAAVGEASKLERFSHWQTFDDRKTFSSRARRFLLSKPQNKMIISSMTGRALMSYGLLQEETFMGRVNVGWAFIDAFLSINLKLRPPLPAARKPGELVP